MGINSILYSVFESIALRMTVITLFIMAIKLVFKNKLTAKMHCMIWIILCIQLLFCIGGVRIQTSASIYNVIPEAPAVSEPVQTSAAPGGTDIRNVIAAVWVIGAALMLLWHLTVFAAYRVSVGRAPEVTEAETLARLRSIRIKLGIASSRRIVLRRGTAAQTLANTVIIPEGFSDSEEYHIMMHELCHYRYYDNLKVWAALGVLCVNWFNPVVWLAYKRFRTDIEMLCDERVLRNVESRREYAVVLVKSAAMKRRFVPGAVSVNNGKHEVAARVRRIGTFRRMKPLWVFAAVCTCVTVSCLCLTDAVTLAVENTVTEEIKLDIAATPEPVPVTEMVSLPAVTAPPAQLPTEAPVAAAESLPVRTADERTREPEVRTEAEAPRYDAVRQEPPVSQPEESNAEAAPEVEPEDDALSNSSLKSVSGNGTKETYSLEDGSTAVLQYNNDELEIGFIVAP